MTKHNCEDFLKKQNLKQDIVKEFQFKELKLSYTS